MTCECAGPGHLCGSNPERDYTVSADGELVTVRAGSIFQAFTAARRLRPAAVVVTDTHPGD